ncbi:unnamed protein product, partial [Hapterophycus canaliculatus]
GPAEGEDRWQNVLELERAASNPKFAGVAGEGALVSFLNEVALGAGGEAAAATKAPMIQLMTVHASKGLEFDTVFVAGCEEGTFPMKDTTDDVVDEEMRLM